MSSRGGDRWSERATVAGFSQSPPNDSLMRVAAAERRRRAGRVRAIDLGCGAGRNAVPLAREGWEVFGIDRSQPMLDAAQRRARAEPLPGSVHVAMAHMDHLPARDRTFDLVIAHGIWNLARSSAEFRRAVHEAARVATPEALLFVFTFSRTTLPPDAQPVPGEPFVFTQFAGEPQCFLTENQLVSELGDAGFGVEAGLPIRELNRPSPGTIRTTAVPVIWEAVFRATSEAPRASVPRLR